MQRVLLFRKTRFSLSTATQAMLREAASRYAEKSSSLY